MPSIHFLKNQVNGRKIEKNFRMRKKIPDNECSKPNDKYAKKNLEMGTKKRWTCELLALNVLKDLFNIALKISLDIFYILEMQMRF